MLMFGHDKKPPAWKYRTENCLGGERDDTWIGIGKTSAQAVVARIVGEW